MTEPTFSRRIPADLFLRLDPPGGASNTAGYTIAYVPLRGGPPVPQRITLRDSWQTYPGVYLFLGALPPDQQAFALALDRYLHDPAYPGTRFLWIANPNDPIAQWRTSRVALSGAASGSVLTTELSLFDFRNIALFAGAGCTVTINAAGDGFDIKAPPDDSRRIYLTARTGLDTLYELPSGLSLSFQGQQAGCLRFPLALQNRPAADPPDFDRLDVGCRFFMDNQDFPGYGFLTSRRYPIFSVQETAVTLYANLDPLNRLVGTRTYFSFLPDGATSGPPLASYYVTNLGYQIRLAPTLPANSALPPRLVFALKPSTVVAQETDPCYLAPAGAFAISVADHGDSLDNNLMCGLSGVEYIKLPPAETTLLHFVPGFPAYAPGFVPGRPPAVGASGTGLSAQAITASVTTAWAYVTGDTARVYYAQPDSSVLYQPDPNPLPDGNNNPFLDYMEVRAAALPNRLPGPTDAFPMVPYVAAEPLDVVFDKTLQDTTDPQLLRRLRDACNKAILDTYKQFEVQVISPVRRAAIHDITMPATPPVTRVLTAGIDLRQLDGDTLSTTPQGLLGVFTPNADDPHNPLWKQLILAQDTDNKQVRFKGLLEGTPLRSALQRSKLFLVISDVNSIGQFWEGDTPDTALTLAGWSCQLGTAKWAAHDTILILKFYDKSLRELVLDTSTWSQAGNFNQDPQNTSTQIQQFIQDTLDRYNAPDASDETKANYQYFVEQVVQSPGWQGIVALRVSVPLTGLPDELEGLAAGIDPDKFYAHHIGVAVTPIDTEQKLAMKPSSLFGLIDYTNPDYPPPVAPTDPPSESSFYNFKVDSLRVLFHNSLITGFSSQIEVTLDHLFGETTALRNSPSGRNNVVLGGRYEDHNGRPAYTFSFSGDNIFALPDSHILNAVEITKAQFTTTVPSGGFQAGSRVESRFAFWGRMNFKIMNLANPKVVPFDMFSFGDEAGSDGQNQTYLTFSNLALEMTFTWGNANERTFVFDPNHIAVDLDHSRARKNSLYAHFPLTFQGLIYSDGKKTPADLGYSTVQSPLASKGLVAGQPWYALTYDLALGTLGALAGDVGISFGMATAWNPGADAVKAFLGLKLPYSHGKNEISLMGVLKLSFGSVQFLANKTEDGGIGYILKLKKMALKLVAVTVPPGGQTEIIIFGDPNAQTSNKTLGWYAAYAKDQPPPVQQPAPGALPKPK